MIHPDLLHPILDNPHDDAPRLIAADWLDEQERQETCWLCNGHGKQFIDVGGIETTSTEIKVTDFRRGSECFRCSGSGVVSNGAADRAELIRVQCELARLRPCGINNDGSKAWHVPGRHGKPDDFGCPQCRLSARERELLTAHGERWIEGLPGHEEAISTNGTEITCIASDITYTFGRGFIGHVKLSCDAFMGRACERCGGRGSFGVALRGHRVHSDPQKCSTCSGHGHVVGIAERLFRACPVTSVVTDRRPQFMTTSGWTFSDYFLDGFTRESIIPNCLTEFMSEVVGHDRTNDTQHGNWWCFKTESAAIDALSTVCVAYGRRLTGLPEMTRATAEIHSMA